MLKICTTLLSIVDKFGVVIETMYHRLPGVYVRTVHMKAGDLVIGAIHKKDHIAIISSGRAVVVSEEMGVLEIVAPAIFSSKAGAYRTVVVQEDMVWSTVHQTDQPVDAPHEELEAELFTIPEFYKQAANELRVI